jgi:5-formyltetrahydrofolate cyclo-ligase
VRAERDLAVKEARWYALRASRAEDRVRAQKAEIARLRARVAFLENQHKVFVPAPCDLEAPTIPIKTVQTTGARVIPLHFKPVGA